MNRFEHIPDGSPVMRPLSLLTSFRKAGDWVPLLTVGANPKRPAASIAVVVDTMIYNSSIGE
jgi:hypothetical protein